MGSAPERTCSTMACARRISGVSDHGGGVPSERGPDGVLQPDGGGESTSSRVVGQDRRRRRRLVLSAGGDRGEEERREETEGPHASSANR